MNESYTPIAYKFLDSIYDNFASTFRYQFIISKHKIITDGFDHNKLQDYNILSSPDLNKCRILDQFNNLIGYILGVAIGPKGEYAKDTLIMHINDTENIEAQVDDFISGFSGRHIFMFCFDIKGENFQRLYLDAIGALAATYDTETKICASTLLLTLTRDIIPNEHFSLPDDIYEIKEFSGLLPPKETEVLSARTAFGHTFDKFVKMLLPDQYLDLNTFETLPRLSNPSLLQPLEVDEAAHIIFERLKTIMHSLMENASGYLAISGGMDSRMLVAAAPKKFSDNFTYYSYADNFATSLDVIIAEEIANSVGERFIGQVPDTGFRGSFIKRKRFAKKLQRKFAISSGLMGVGDRWWQRGYFKDSKKTQYGLEGLC